MHLFTDSAEIVANNLRVVTVLMGLSSLVFYTLAARVPLVCTELP